MTTHSRNSALPVLAGDAAPVFDTLTDQPPAPVPPLGTLRLMVQDAADRAAHLLAGGHAPRLDTGPDVARFLSAYGTAHLDAAARHLGLAPPEVRHLVTAYEHGGQHGATVYLTPCVISPETLDRAQEAVQPLRPSPLAPIERQDNRLTDGPARVQLRYGPDHRWYPYINSFSTWQPASGPDPDPATVYQAARAALRSRLHRA